MKLVRPLLLSLAALALLAAVIVALAFAPPVQRWALGRVLAARPELGLGFDEFSAGFSRAQIRGLRLDQPGLHARVSLAEVDYSLPAFLFQGRLTIARFTARGVEIDTSRRSPAATRVGATGGSAAAPGAIARTRLPWLLEIGRAEINGRVLLPGPAGRPPVPADFSVEGGDLAPGRDGRFRFRIDVRDDQAGAPVAALRTTGELSLRQADARDFDHADLSLTIDASGPRLAEPSQLRLTARVAPEGAAARYTLRVDTVRAGRVENLASIDAAAPAREAEFTGRWELQANQSQLEPFLLGGGLPRFQAKGQGTFSARTDTGAAALAGRLELDAAGLEALAPALRAIGPLRLETEFDVASAGAVLTVNRLALQLSGEQPALAAASSGPIVVDRTDGGWKVSAASGEVGRILFHGVPVAWMRPFIEGGDVTGDRLQGELVLRAGSDHLLVETLTPLTVGRLSVVRDGRLWLDRADLRLVPAGRFGPAGYSLALREFTLRTPAGDSLDWQVRAEVPGGSPGHVNVSASGRADLPSLLAPFAGLGHLRGEGEFEFAVSPERFELLRMRSEIANGRGEKLVALTGGAAVLDLKNFRLVPSQPGEIELGRMTFERIALDQFPFLQALVPLRGELAAGGFVVTGRGDRIFARPTSAVQLSGLTVESAGRRWIDGLAVQSSPTLEFGGLGDWKIADGATALRDRSGGLLLEMNVEASAGEGGVRAGASFNADLAALGAQPAFASLAVLASGRASGEVRAAVSSQGTQVEARSTVNSLVARVGNEALPIANLSLRALRDTTGRLSVEVPVLLDRLGQRSDLKFTLGAGREGDEWTVNARLTGDHLELADLVALAALAGGGSSRPGPVAVTAKSPARPIEADARPAWAGLRGQLEIDVKEIVRGSTWTATGLRGRARLASDRLSLLELTSKVNTNGDFGAKGELTFTGGARPYALQGDFSLSEFDVGALLKAFDPERPPTLEGVFTVKGRVAGAGATLDDTLARTRGSFELSSQRGVFRGLRRTSEKVSVATKAVDAVAALGSLLGSSKVKAAAEKVAGQTYQIDQLAQALAELPFHQFGIRAQRDDALNFRIEELSLMSPEVRLSARGTLTHVEGKPLLEQPLSLNYQLATRGRVEQTFARLKALDGSKDDLGYSRVKDLGTITGTPSRPVPNDLFVRLAESKLGDFLN